MRPLETGVIDNWNLNRIELDKRIAGTQIRVECETERPYS